MDNVKIELTKEELKTIIKEAIFEYEEEKKQTKKSPNKVVSENSIYKNVSMNIINFMNIRCDKGFRHTDANIKIITDRLKAKDLSICEALGIINYKADEWLNDEKMNMYLRPSTLFNKTKCNEYVGDLKNRYKYENVQQVTLKFIEEELDDEQLKLYIRSKNSINPIEENGILL